MKLSRFLPLLAAGLLALAFPGLAAEPYLVKDINTGQAGASSSDPSGVAKFGSAWYFYATSTETGGELWKTDGTDAGTALVKDINTTFFQNFPGPPIPNSSGIHSLTPFNGALYFIADDGVNGGSLWKTDGTDAGTVMVKDLMPSQMVTPPGGIVVYNGALYFGAQDTQFGYQIWKSDGTTAGTARLTDLGAYGILLPQALAVAGGKIYFRAQRQGFPDNTLEVWTSDGTAAGNTLVKGGFPFLGGAGFLDYFTDVNGVVFFSAPDATNGIELWKTDGTQAGTVLVKNLRFGFGNSYPSDLVAFNGLLYFTAFDQASNDYRFWRSDGTAAGTYVVTQDIGAPVSTVVANGKMYFGAGFDNGRWGLFRSDGTALGTQLIKEYVEPVRGVYFAGGRLFFSAKETATGYELWSLADLSFAFLDIEDAQMGLTYVSDSVTPVGLAGPTAISVTGGEYSIGCNGTFTAAAGTINAGQSVCVRHAAAAATLTRVDTVLTIGTASDTFSTTTAASSVAAQVAGFYRTILERPADAGGQSFWEGEAARMQGLGASLNEAWFAMSSAFFNGAEYKSKNRSNADFVDDLYLTFFNRIPPQADNDFWVGALAQGMPREVLITAFLFSPEYDAFLQSIFGNIAARKEVDMVMDFYRGYLARLPDNGGFAYWVDQFRQAQCQGSAAVISRAESMSSQFALGGEYATRTRTNAQYVGDLYNAILRRGGDLGGVLFWINQLNSGAMTREQLRQAFVNGQEFSGRVAGVIAQGCMM